VGQAKSPDLQDMIHSELGFSGRGGKGKQPSNKLRIEKKNGKGASEKYGLGPRESHARFRCLSGGEKRKARTHGGIHENGAQSKEAG